MRYRFNKITNVFVNISSVKDNKLIEDAVEFSVNRHVPSFEVMNDINREIHDIHWRRTR